jgi:hypothetical protein
MGIVTGIAVPIVAVLAIVKVTTRGKGRRHLATPPPLPPSH